MFSSLKLSAVLLPAVASAVNVFFDPVYNNPNGSLTTVACSNGSNGLITRFGFQNFSDVPTFPNIGGADVIQGFNSAGCGTCFNITFTDSNQTTTSITYTALDVAGDGFVASEDALNTLTGGQAERLGVINATAVQLDPSACGL
ncbi:SnodProt1 [Dendrothele bispora CBS 962.96]|uniref:SnodProt1 n=1 Tax=Dendrothele bispora (strain CBS 962.96) TaxID=1314807 RepID=A0A4S8M625_DENBC|nr:SnodProt1 [Dendrothele bispora CBS 962.96]